MQDSVASVEDISHSLSLLYTPAPKTGLLLSSQPICLE